MMKKKVDVRERTSYSIEEKLIVVKYALENGNLDELDSDIEIVDN